jgi:MoaF C-terminal domain/MoaF N-terminal domain
VETLTARIFRPKGPYEQRISWSDNRRPSTDALAGKEVALERDDGKTVTYAFDDKSVSWKEPGENSTVQAPYEGVELRDAVFSVEILHAEVPGQNPWRREATSLALNMGTGGALLVRNTITLGDKKEFRQDIYPCTIAGSGGSLPALSAELVGRRAYAEYTDGRAAEHVYLNPRRFAWQGLGRFDYSGAGCEDSTTWKLGNELFLLTWVEEWELVGVVLLMDFAGLQNAGVILGRDDHGFFHFPCGARLALLGQTTYPPGKEPAGVGGPSERRDVI